ncbi:hypothetical protein BV20DRAFT_983280 [Pilatotrama ljubarskyi]|nr:hypothetical protein BV20DRAFT_983280 [Pilatotrama ljubarskyi]
MAKPVGKAQEDNTVDKDDLGHEDQGIGVRYSRPKDQDDGVEHEWLNSHRPTWTRAIGTYQVPVRAHASLHSLGLVGVGTASLGFGPAVQLLQRERKTTITLVTGKLREDFVEYLVSRVCELEGTQKPWTGLLVGEIQMLLKTVFPDINYILQPQDTVVDVINICLTSWWSEFCRHALAAVDAYFTVNTLPDSYDFSTVDGHHDYCLDELLNGKDAEGLPFI